MEIKSIEDFKSPSRREGMARWKVALCCLGGGLVGGLVLGALLTDFNYIQGWLDWLGEKTQSIEIENVKITFNSDSFGFNPDLQTLSPQQRLEVLKNFKRLGPGEFNRLLHATEFGSKVINIFATSPEFDHENKDFISCDYDKATEKMRRFAADDQGLYEKKLVELTYGRELNAIVAQAVHLQEQKTSKKSDIGYPSNCYTMTLTKQGRDLKSMIVSELTLIFATNLNAQ